MHIDLRSLEGLFNPPSIAVYGASGNTQKIGGRALRYLEMMQFPGAIYPINPGQDKVQGYKAHPTAEAIPGEVGLAILAIPATAVKAALEDCARKGIRAVLVMSSGFAEIGGDGVRMQSELLTLARAAGMRLLGPNCVGFVNAAKRVSATFSTSRELCWPEVGKIGFASQSGAFGSLCAGTMRNSGLGLGTWITTGNEADVDLADAIAFLSNDASVNVIAAYMEGCRNAAKLAEALGAARQAGKPVIMLKTGTTEVGAAAAASHTASMAGRDELFDAFFRAHGVIRVDSVEALLDTAYVCSTGVRPASRRTVIISTSGGVGVLMGDTAVESGLVLEPLPETVQNNIREILPYAGTRNPVDTTAQIISDVHTFNPCFEFATEGARADVVIAYLALLGYDEMIMDRVCEPLFALRRAHPDRLFAVAMLCSPAIKAAFEQAGFVVFSDPSRAVKAAARASQVAELLARLPPASPATSRSRPHDLETETAAKRFIVSAGIPIPREDLATSAEQAGRFAAQIDGKVVMKIVSPDIAHKTEVGGVLLNVTGSAAARAAYNDLMERVGKARPQARLEGVLVSEQIEGGIETIAGVISDPILGPFVMFGLGGIYAEVLKDVVFRPAPFGRSVGREMVDELKAAAVLKGARGRPPGDLEALADSLSRLSQLAAENRGWLDSIDINPLIVRPNGVAAVDALVVSR